MWKKIHQIKFRILQEYHLNMVIRYWRCGNNWCIIICRSNRAALSKFTAESNTFDYARCTTDIFLNVSFNLYTTNVSCFSFTENLKLLLTGWQMSIDYNCNSIMRIFLDSVESNRLADVTVNRFHWKFVQVIYTLLINKGK